MSQLTHRPIALVITLLVGLVAATPAHAASTTSWNPAPSLISTPSEKELSLMASNIAAGGELRQAGLKSMPSITLLTLEEAAAISQRVPIDLRIGRPRREVVAQGDHALVVDEYINKSLGKLTTVMSEAPVTGLADATRPAEMTMTQAALDDKSISVTVSSGAITRTQIVAPNELTCKDVVCALAGAGVGVGAGVACAAGILPTLGLDLFPCMTAMVGLVGGATLVCAAQFNDNCTLQQVGGEVAPSLSMNAPDCNNPGPGSGAKGCQVSGFWTVEQNGYTLEGAVLTIGWMKSSTYQWETSTCESGYASPYYLNNCNSWNFDGTYGGILQPGEHYWYGNHWSTQTDCQSWWTANVQVDFDFTRNFDGAPTRVTLQYTGNTISCF